jgi:hypothetical protein
MLEIHGGDPKLMCLNPFVVYTVINPITLEKHNISFVVIIQFKNLFNDTIIYVFPTV